MIGTAYNFASEFNLRCYVVEFPAGTVDAAVERMLKVMKAPDAAAAQKAARAAGYVIAGGAEWADTEALLAGLFALSKSKAEEVHMVGRCGTLRNPTKPYETLRNPTKPMLNAAKS